MFYATPRLRRFDAAVCGLKFFGADHVFASDAPFDPERADVYRETTRSSIAFLATPIGKIRRNADELLKSIG